MSVHRNLRDVYYNPKHPGSFCGLPKFVKEAKMNCSEAKRILENSETYTKHKRSRHKFVRRKITSPEIDYLWQADLVSVQKLATRNKNYNFLLTVIDVLSRFAFVVPIKNKSGSQVTLGFKKIFEESNRQPKFLQTDFGKEFFNSSFISFLRSKKIKLYHNHSPLKAAMIERFNQTLLSKLHRYFTFKKSFVYHDVLSDMIQSYNNSIHRIIKCRPVEVNKYNQFDVWLRSNKDLYTKTVKSNVFKVGDFVRCKIPKQTFEKGYTQKYSDEVYAIKEVVNSQPITYKIGNEKQEILGIFYPDELSKVII